MWHAIERSGAGRRRLSHGAWAALVLSVCGANDVAGEEAEVRGATPVVEDQAVLRVMGIRAEGRPWTFDLSGASGSHFVLGVRIDEASPWTLVGPFALDDDGSGRAQLEGDVAWLESDRWTACAFFRQGGAMAVSSSLEFPLEQPLGQPLDFDWGLGGVALVEGDVITSLQPWREIIEVGAVASDGGAGAGTLVATDEVGDEPFGHVLVVAADEVDSDGDGRIDDPRSDPAGGILSLQFPGSTDVSQLWVVDVIGEGGVVRTYRGDELLGTVGIPDLGGSGAEVIYPEGFSITRLEVEFVGEGALGDVLISAHPMVLNFDETTTGVPLALQAGDEVRSEYDGIGLFAGFIEVENGHPDHPDVAIVFDSSSPTGGDQDLRTPGRGIGNDVAHRNVLIIAENDVDADGDGRVDEPDDEAAGGVLRFIWVTNTIHFRSITVVDVDDRGDSFVRVYDDLSGRPIDISLEDLGDNSVQTVFGDVPTRVIEVHLAGSGAVAELRVAPPPAR